MDYGFGENLVLDVTVAEAHLRKRDDLTKNKDTDTIKGHDPNSRTDQICPMHPTLILSGLNDLRTSHCPYLLKMCTALPNITTLRTKLPMHGTLRDESHCKTQSVSKAHLSLWDHNQYHQGSLNYVLPVKSGARPALA